MEPIELVEYDGVVGYWFDDSTPQEVLAEAEARAIWMVAERASLKKWFQR